MRSSCGSAERSERDLLSAGLRPAALTASGLLEGILTGYEKDICRDRTEVATGKLRICEETGRAKTFIWWNTKTLESFYTNGGVEVMR